MRMSPSEVRMITVVMVPSVSWAWDRVGMLWLLLIVRMSRKRYANTCGSHYR